MTKIIVQHFVENLLKLLKLLKTRKRARNGLAELRIRYARQGAKALSKQRSKTELKTSKPLKNLSTSIIIGSEEERKMTKMTLKSYKVEMTNKKTGKKETRHTLAESKKLAKCLIWTKEDIISQWKISKIEED